ncbi:MAG: apolipoprotein N-acyltransferase [Bacteroidales bacterium]|jgi:apolipoprotein N-acyltransferase|nr:apolipoprotein N-acyltransferase [Bacteroidales bacterium]
MKRYQNLIQSVLSGVLFGLAWPPNGIPFILFLAFVPLLLLEDNIAKDLGGAKTWRVIGNAYLAFIVWHIISVWWIWNASSYGSILAILLNASFMAIAFGLYSFTKKYFNKREVPYFLLIIFWIAFEYFHLDWPLSFPWLNIGNAFAKYPSLIQWYEYTGIFGGSLWILLSNIGVYKIYRLNISKIQYKKTLVYSFYLITLIALPIVLSTFRYNNYVETENPVDIVVVQPNMDPYSEQYDAPPQEVIHRIIRLSEPLLDTNTIFLLAPESAIQEHLQEPDFNYSTSLGSRTISIPLLKYFLADYPNINLLIGLSSYKFLDEPTITARTTNSGAIYDEYNTALYLNRFDNREHYHKSKFVPGAEMMPFQKLLAPFQQIAFDLGGTVGSLGYDTERKVFTSVDGRFKIGPMICFESVFGEFTNGYVQNGAQLLGIITNDGWWGNTSGYKQHLMFASLRAIETRRSIARSANTGTSCYINQRGDIYDKTEYWVQDARKATINANDAITFYVRYGDYIGRLSSFVAVLFLLISFSMMLRKRVN